MNVLASPDGTTGATVLERRGVVLPHGYVDVPHRELQDLAAQAESLGYERLWVPELDGADAVSLLAGLATVTQRIGLASGVLNVFSRTPALLAQTAAGLDALSNGRFLLGLGVSTHTVVQDWHGLTFDRPATRLRETIGVVRAMLGYECPHIRRDAQAIPRAPKLKTREANRQVPIAVGALSAAGTRIAAELADVWHPALFDTRSAERAFGKALQGGMQARDPCLGGLEAHAAVPVAVDDDTGLASRRVRDHLASYIGVMGSASRNFNAELIARYGFEQVVAQVRAYALTGDLSRAARAIPDALVERLAACGPAEVAERQLSCMTRSGIDVPLLVLVGRSHDERLAALYALAPSVRTPTHRQGESSCHVSSRPK